MERTKINKSYTVEFSGNLLNQNGMLSNNITVPFAPDEVIIRQIVYSTTAGEEADAYFIKTNFTPHSIGAFSSGTNISPNIIYQLYKQPVVGNMTFTITVTRPGGTVATTLVGDLVVYMEFVEYFSNK